MKIINRLRNYWPIIILLFFSCRSQDNSNQVQTIKSVEQKIQIEESKSKYNTQFFSELAKRPLNLKLKYAINSMLEDSNGNIWFGSRNEGVCYFDGKELKYFMEKKPLGYNRVTAILEDYNGDIWIEAIKGISKFNGDTLIAKPHKNATVKSKWQIGKNDLWFNGDAMGSHAELEEYPGIYRYDGSKFDYCIFPMERNGNPFYNEGSTSFLKGKNNMIWFGTNAAVIGYDGKSFKIIDNKSLGISAKTGTGSMLVKSIFEDSKGNLWIGNEGIGLLIHSQNKTINFSKLNDLIDNFESTEPFVDYHNQLKNILAIEEDKYGNIWIGERRTGAWKYDGKSSKNYTKKDGLTTRGV